MPIDQLYSLFLQCNGVSTDTRAIAAGDLFVALKGPNFNGNRFAQQALDAGAKYVMVDEDCGIEGPVIQVPDCLVALQNLARRHRQSFDIPVIAITGSNGKTTTKELLYSVLSQGFKTHATAGNLNNHIGVPLTLLRMPSDTEVAIIEMGANHTKEIESYCQWAMPNYGVITNVGKAHLEGFGSEAGVLEAKTELYAWLKAHGGHAFVPSNMPQLMQHARVPLSNESYGEQAADFVFQIQENPHVSLEVAGEEYASQLSGRFNAYNIAAAVVIGRHLGLSTSQIQTGLAAYAPSNNRSQWMEYKGAQLFLDAYNANPSSMEVALVAIAGFNEQPKLAILGGMNELGEYSQAAHQKLYDLAMEQSYTQVALVGAHFDAIDAPKAQRFADTEALKAWFNAQDWQGYTILLKGSRGNRLEQLIEN